METETQKNVLSENPSHPQTPRRSARKSVMPVQDYEQIVNQKRILRSTTKENTSKDTTVVGIDEEEKIRWTPAKVGRVSEKRGKRGRKTKRRQTFEVDCSQVEQLKKTDLMELGLEVLRDEKDIEMQVNEMENEKVIEINDTLNCSDCIIVSPNPKESTIKTDANTSSLESSVSNDVVEKPFSSKVPTIVITSVDNIEKEEENVKTGDISTATENEIIVSEEIPIDQKTEPGAQSSAMISELLTANCDVKQPNEQPPNTECIMTTVENEEMLILEDVTTDPEASEYMEEDEDPQLCVTMPVVALEPVEIILHSIRKRSLSLCIGDINESRVKERRNVTFHSPANQTTAIEDLDMLIAQSLKKNSEQNNDNDENKDQNVTQRRKRSLSFNDTSLLASKPIVRKGTPKKPERTPIKGALGGATRTKLPNFAAIHEKHFNKMENLVEHVARKAERAKILSSATKTNPLNKITPSKAFNLSLKKDESQKSIAMKKIEWPTPKKGELHSIEKRPKLAIIKPIPSNTTTTSQVKPVQLSKLPIKTIKKPNPVNIKSNTTILEKSNTTILEKKEPQKIVTSVKSKSMDTKPIISDKKEPTKSAKSIFNISTTLNTSTKPVSLSTATTRIVQAQTHEDKLAMRRQRHIDMFKGRTAATSTHKTDNLLRGVRSNRRFELQMQHRRNMEEK